ncbi:MAG: DUF4097 domain-containing protein [Candidatus Glassbacteria bacterium]|nr:DUF4097 domain-containing protein [Candidatus Glassbacteria bacterium]
MKIISGLILSILVCLNLSAGDLLCADRLERSFPARPGGQLTVITSGSQIKVEGAEVSTYAVTIECKKSIEEYYQVDFASTGDGLTITVERKKTDKLLGIIGSGKAPGLKIAVIAPRETGTDLKTSGGGIDLRNLAGELQARTSGGKITCDGIDGALAVHTSGGSISCANISGSLDARTSGGGISLASVDGPFTGKTSGGSINAERITGDGSLQTSGGKIHLQDSNGRIDLHTSGGGITAEHHEGSITATTSGGGIKVEFVTPPTGDSELKTSGGGITFSMPRGSSAHLDAKTSGGNVSSDFAVLVASGTQKRNRLEGKIGEGGPLLSLRASGGSIRIREN